MRRVAMLLVLSSLVGGSIGVPPAGAGPEAHDVTGTWRGFFQIDGVAPPNDGMPVSFEVLSQDGRRFSGLFAAGELSCVLDGTLSESLWMNAQGDCGPMSRLVVQGQATDTNEFGVIIPCVFEGRWTHTSMGGNQRGALVLLHDGEGPKHLVDGTWEGQAFDDDGNRVGQSSAEFGRSEGRPVSAIRFEDIEGNEEVFEVLLDLTHLPDPQSTSGFAAVGSGNDRLLFLSGQFTPAIGHAPATIEGTSTQLIFNTGGQAPLPPPVKVLWSRTDE